MAELMNPILPGFYPDPSICRVDDDFYMVTSSFSYFPGIPVFHSRDLQHWEQLGHVMDRPEQLPLNWQRISGGIFAPTIRYHEGLFYVICTNVSHGGDFICTAENPAGPWSDPHYIQNAPGIDPTIFWDDDGKCYMTGTCEWGSPEHGVWISELDLNEWKLVGERKTAWCGAAVNAWAPEAPHIYKKDGWYYLMIAEGGTEHYHAVTIARSKEIMGEYKGYEGNPILTHRHLGENYPICNVGHGDLVQLKDGTWYMVMLASRIYGGYHKNMGRETFIAPVDWSGEWPVVSPGTGRVEWRYPAPKLPAFKPAFANEDSFTSMVWNTLGTPEKNAYEIFNGSLYLRCMARKPLPDKQARPELPNGMLPFYGRRQQHMTFSASMKLTMPEISGISCGMMVLQNNFAQLRIELVEEEGSAFAQAVKGWTDDNGRHEEVLGRIPYPEHTCEVTISAEEQDYSLIVDSQVLATVNGGFMGSETCGGFVGAYIGPFATGNGVEHSEACKFERFNYQGQ